ncbi:MAG TPA: protein kinase [Sandaracinaceae bacterium LLY-WYZ-13_1]|nr:protein kinase [Sandaracinaceae bacterium LLY-WYZ-13_1]
MGGDQYSNPPATFDEDESTVMMPTFSDGSFFADRYRIESLLGAGAMGRVYAAVELHSGRRVALKVLHKERLAEEETVERFRREAEVLASIGHPCIVEIHTFHHDRDGTPYLAMELLEGVTLKTRLQSAGRFEDPLDLQEVLDGICGALSAAHARGIVHRDLKPDNIFLLATGEPRAKLVDFGLSRLAKADKSLTRSGMILGTPRYMAPEQIRDASSAGPSVDIYSLGILVFEALTGQSPYPAEDYGQLLGCVMEGRTTALEEVRPELAAIGEVIRRATHPEVSVRYQSCDELADAYAAAVGRPSRRAQIASLRRPEPPRPRRHSSATIPVNKGSTLAFDVSALGGQLPDLPAAAPAGSEPEPLAPPPPVWDTEDVAPPVDPNAATAAAGEVSGVSPPGRAGGVPPSALPARPLDDSDASGERTAAYPRHPGGSPPGPASPAPSASGAGVHAQGGDTMFLPQAGEGGPPVPPPPAAGMPPAAHPTSAHPTPAHPTPAHPTPAHPTPGAHPGTPAPVAPSGPPPRFSSAGPAPGAGAQPKKKGGCGFVVFLVAAVLVVALSAAGGFALRAYTRGELDLPFDLPLEREVASDEATVGS